MDHRAIHESSCSRDGGALEGETVLVGFIQGRTALASKPNDRRGEASRDCADFQIGTPTGWSPYRYLSRLEGFSLVSATGTGLHSARSSSVKDNP